MRGKGKSEFESGRPPSTGQYEPPNLRPEAMQGDVGSMRKWFEAREEAKEQGDAGDVGPSRLSPSDKVIGGQVR